MFVLIQLCLSCKFGCYTHEWVGRSSLTRESALITFKHPFHLFNQLVSPLSILHVTLSTNADHILRLNWILHFWTSLEWQTLPVFSSCSVITCSTQSTTSTLELSIFVRSVSGCNSHFEFLVLDFFQTVIQVNQVLFIQWNNLDSSTYLGLVIGDSDSDDVFKQVLVLHVLQLFHLFTCDLGSLFDNLLQVVII